MTTRRKGSYEWFGAMHFQKCVVLKAMLRPREPL